MKEANEAAMAVDASCGVPPQEGKKIGLNESCSAVEQRIEQLSESALKVLLKSVYLAYVVFRSACVIFLQAMDRLFLAGATNPDVALGGMDVLLSPHAELSPLVNPPTSSTTPYINERVWLLEGLEFVHHNRAGLAERRAVWVYWKVLREKGQLARISTTAELARTLRKLLSGREGTRKTVCGADSVEPSHVFKNVPAALKNAPLEQWEEAARGDPTLQRYVVFKHKAEAFVEKKLINVPPHR